MTGETITSQDLQPQNAEALKAKLEKISLEISKAYSAYDQLTPINIEDWELVHKGPFFEFLKVPFLLSDNAVSENKTPSSDELRAQLMQIEARLFEKLSDAESEMHSNLKKSLGFVESRIRKKWRNLAIVSIPKELNELQQSEQSFQRAVISIQTKLEKNQSDQLSVEHWSLIKSEWNQVIAKYIELSEHCENLIERFDAIYGNRMQTEYGKVAIYIALFGISLTLALQAFDFFRPDDPTVVFEFGVNPESE